MSLQKVFIIVAVALFGSIGVAALIKGKAKAASASTSTSRPIEIDLPSMQAYKSMPMQENRSAPLTTSNIVAAKEDIVDDGQQEPFFDESSQKNQLGTALLLNDPDDPRLPEGDCMALLFQKNSPLPIVETIQYKSRVAWKKRRSAWLVDYASHYKTPLHFILRSINGRANYAVPPINDGQEFAILRQNNDYYFYLLIDLSRCKLWCYYIFESTGERVLLKSYRVGLGRLDASKASGSLTPYGKYQLSNRGTIYQPKMKGIHKGKRVEMMTVFGTRWLPFEKEIERCSEGAKGFGIHGTPWMYDDAQELIENSSSIGKYESDGCIRLKAADVEELYSVISTKGGVVEIVKDFFTTTLPGKEKNKNL